MHMSMHVHTQTQKHTHSHTVSHNLSQTTERLHPFTLHQIIPLHLEEHFLLVINTAACVGTHTHSVYVLSVTVGHCNYPYCSLLLKLGWLPAYESCYHNRLFLLASAQAEETYVSSNLIHQPC